MKCMEFSDNKQIPKNTQLLSCVSVKPSFLFLHFYEVGSGERTAGADWVRSMDFLIFFYLAGFYFCG